MAKKQQLKGKWTEIVVIYLHSECSVVYLFRFRMKTSHGNGEYEKKTSLGTFKLHFGSFSHFNSMILFQSSHSCKNRFLARIGKEFVQNVENDIVGCEFRNMSF